MQYWQKHLQQAVLGTSRAPWSPAELPYPVRKHLPEQEGSDTAAVFLDATVLLYAYTKAGVRSTVKTETLLEAAPEDELPFCTPAAIDLWRRIRALESKNPVLEMRWLELCHRSRYVLAPDVLVDVFTLGAQKKMAALRPYIAKVAGARGRWLAGFFSEWAYVEQGNIRKVWLEGKPAERAEVFRSLRRDHPALAVQMLSAGWDKEPVADRKRFLEIMAEKSDPGDLAFFEQIYQEYAAMEAGGKAPVMEVKRWITRLLLLQPDATLRQNWIAALSRYFSTSGKLAWTLPTAEDDFFNTPHLSVMAGFAKPAAGQLAVTSLFHQLAGGIPPAVWVAASGATPEKTLEALGLHAEVRHFLIRASIDHNDPTFAEWLLPHSSGDVWHQLLAVVPEGRREILLMTNAAYSERLNWASPALHFRWSPEFSKWVLQQLYDSWIGYYFHRIQQIMPLDVYLHPSVKPGSIPGLYDQSMKRGRWMEVIVPELEQTLLVSGGL